MISTPFFSEILHEEIKIGFLCHNSQHNYWLFSVLDLRDTQFSVKNCYLLPHIGKAQVAGSQAHVVYTVVKRMHLEVCNHGLVRRAITFFVLRHAACDSEGNEQLTKLFICPFLPCYSYEWEKLERIFHWFPKESVIPSWQKQAEFLIKDKRYLRSLSAAICQLGQSTPHRLCHHIRIRVSMTQWG